MQWKCGARGTAEACGGAATALIAGVGAPLVWFGMETGTGRLLPRREN